VLPNSLFLAVFACVAWWLFRAAETPLVTYVPLADYWQYVAALREWSANLLAPGNPTVVSAELSLSYNPYLGILAALASAFGLDAMQALALGSALNLLIIAAGMRLFLQAYFRNSWAPAIGLLAVFFCWGIGWNQHNVYQLGSFLHTASYPSTFAFGISLIAFRLTLQLLSNDALTMLWGAMLAVAVALTLLCDPVTSAFCVVGCVLLVLTEPTGSRINQLLPVAMVFAGMGLAEVWPFFSPWKALLGLYPGSQGSTLDEWLMPVQRLLSGEWKTVLYSPSLVIATLGFALLGVPLLIWLGMRREQSFLVCGAVLMLAPYLLNLLFPIPQGERFLLFVATYLQLAIVWGWLRLIGAWNEIPRPAVAAPALLLSIVAGAGVFVLNLWMAGLDFSGKRLAPNPISVIDVRKLPDALSVDQLYAELFADVPRDAVVLSTADDGHALAALSHKVVATRYADPVLSDRTVRYEDAGTFFFRPVSELERVEVIQRYDISHVLVNASIQKVADRAEPWVANYGRLLAERGNYRVYELSPALHDVALPEPEAVAEKQEVVTPEQTAESVPMQANSELARPVRTPVDEEPVVDEEPAARSFGAPISAPVLDPSRHGG